MSLDKILILFSMFDKDVLKDKVEFKNPLSKKIFICKNSSKAYVLLSPWHADKSTFYFLKNKIIKAGFSCILYSFIPDILSPDVEGTRKYFEDIEKKIKNDLVEFKKQHNIKSFVVVGFSLSCVTASMVSSSNELVDGVIFIAPGITLAEPMWYGLRTKNIRKIMEKNGVTPVCLKNQWDNLAPGKYVQGFKNKQVKILLSQSDIIVPYLFGKEFANTVKEFIPNAIIEENKHLGHYGTMLNFCFISKNIDFRKN